MEEWLDINPDPVHVKREREKARELRRTDWWRSQLQKGVCHYCQRKVGAENLTLDHVIPVSRGGRSTRGNCVPCCKDCNNRKKYYTPVEMLLESAAAKAPSVPETNGSDSTDFTSVKPE